MKEQKEQLTVKSKINGTVLKINEQGGAHPEDAYGGTESTTLMEVADTSKFTITGNISERQSLDVEVGHSVFVYSDTLTESTWNGEVIDVSYFPTESNEWYGESSGSQYPVTILVTEGDTEMLRPGYQVFAEILTSEQSGLAVPMEALKYDEFSTYVLVYEDGLAVKREVEIGFSNDYSIEIISGLTEEDQVILDYTEMIEEGMEVVPYDYGEFEEDSFYEDDESIFEEELDEGELEEEIESEEEKSTDEGEEV
ncbi:efflux RND transporter periplasmic adaptor subunit [Bacillus sp. JCM 19041]|uniref:efflux RND transporter periplasmic adaptor subunit n=1 Tax=Bacillus sp. JCM 19041 TaxID=1460637 RepID=UPI0006D0AB79